MFEVAVQTAIYNALSNDAGITVNVFDYVEQDYSGFPYIVIGNDNHISEDTDTENFNRVSVVIHTWSRYAGKKEIKTLQGAIYNALHRATLEYAGYNFINCMFEDSQVIEDSDGATLHGVQTFNILIEEL